jgi:hypothetical protein
MTWTQFTDAVKVMLTVDKDRLGGEDFIDQQIRAGVYDIQSVIPLYRRGHQEIYLPANATPLAACSRITLPDQAEVQDVYYLRTKTPDDPLDGTTAANAATTITGVGTDFLSVLRIGDYIALSSAATTWGMVTEVHSDTEIVVATALGDGTEQTIKKQVRYKYPCLPWPWEQREELFNQTTCILDKALITIDPVNLYLFVYPSLQTADADGYASSLEVNWNGVKIEWSGSNVTPFDERVVHAVADWVKGECARHFDHDTPAWQTFLQPFQGPGSIAGTYYQKRRALYLTGRDRGFAK